MPYPINEEKEYQKFVTYLVGDETDLEVTIVLRDSWKTIFQKRYNSEAAARDALITWFWKLCTPSERAQMRQQIKERRERHAAERKLARTTGLDRYGDNDAFGLF